MPPGNLLRQFLGSFSSVEPGETGRTARRTLAVLSLCFAFDGAYLGIFVSYSVYILKTAIAQGHGCCPWLGDDLLIALAAMCNVVGLTFSYMAGYYFQGRSKKPLFITAASLSGLAAVAFFFVGPGVQFLPLIALASLADAIRLPARNSIIQANFSPRERSRMLGILIMINAGVSIVTILLTGLLLDSDIFLYRWLFPLGIAMMVFSNLAYSRVATNPPASAAPNRFSMARPFESWGKLYDLLRADRSFLWFQIGFFLYGMAFMIVAAMYPIYFYDRFQATPTQFGYTVLILSAMNMTAPWVGRLADKSNPIRTSALCFLVLAFTPILLMPAYLLFHAYIAHVVYSLALTGVFLTWNTGPIFFSGGRDSSPYVGVHATLTGLRAIVVFPIAGYIKQYSDGFIPVFALAAVLYFLGYLVMVRLERQVKASPKFRTSVSGRLERIS
jgi:MFS family permease